MEINIIFEVIDKTGRKIRLTKKQWKRIQKHPRIHESFEKLKEIIENTTETRYDEFRESVNYFYREYKDMDPKERYFCFSNYLNGKGFIITSFYTNKITGLK